MSKTVIAIASTTVSLPKNGSADDLKAGRIPIERRDHQREGSSTGPESAG
jgi:hypothetical protein